MEKLENGIITTSLFDGHVIHGVSTKELGNMSFDRSQKGRAQKNFQAFMALLSIDLNESAVCILPAKHTALIVHVEKKLDRGRIILTPDRENREIIQWGKGDSTFKGLLKNYDQGIDSAVSKSRRLYLALLHADCAPVLLYDPKTHYFGLVHAGIIGAVSNIVPATVRYLQAHCLVSPKRLLAYIGPSICLNCYDPTRSRHWQDLKSRLSLLQNCFDLKDYIFNQLLSCGLVKANIESSRFCTSCSRDLFFSNHAAKEKHATEGRQMTIIGLPWLA